MITEHDNLCYYFAIRQVPLCGGVLASNNNNNNNNNNNIDSL